MSFKSPIFHVFTSFSLAVILALGIKWETAIKSAETQSIKNKQITLLIDYPIKEKAESVPPLKNFLKSYFDSRGYILNLELSEAREVKNPQETKSSSWDFAIKKYISFSKEMMENKEQFELISHEKECKSEAVIYSRKLDLKKEQLILIFSLSYPTLPVLKFICDQKFKNAKIMVTSNFEIATNALKNNEYQYIVTDYLKGENYSYSLLQKIIPQNFDQTKVKISNYGYPCTLILRNSKAKTEITKEQFFQMIKNVKHPVFSRNISQESLEVFSEIPNVCLENLIRNKDVITRID